MDKAKMMDALYDDYKKRFCDKEIVLGTGNLEAKILMVGEAPGKDEVRLSRPFSGMAGRNLDEFLSLLDIGRSSIYITNAIKYRLAKTNPKTGRISNRPATRREIIESREYLIGEIDIINPEYIVTLGNTALWAVTGDFGLNVGTLHGKIHKILNKEKPNIKLYSLYHPASIIYNRSLKSTYIEDILRLKDEICR
ncbi:MAG TPA: uracil-DNA glycosylase [Clostridiaceae bacterium]|nr:uracil-DNA glycosylase [Clostridiaceae bacterium]